jgi:hypothetical protein
VIRSPKEGRETPTVGSEGGASICGTTGTWIAGGGGAGGGGGLKIEPPGGMTCCAELALVTSAHITTPIRTDDNRFMQEMSCSPGKTARNSKLNYSSGAFSIGSNLSASRPSRFHDCSICGGSGAVASM